MERSLVKAAMRGNEIVGRALYDQSMHLWDRSTGNVVDFTSRFTFAIDSKSRTEFADGLAFSRPHGSQIPEGSKGGSLGLTNSTNSGLAFVAVEFDTSTNNGLDPGCYHVAIDVDSLVSVHHACVPWVKYSILNGEQLHAQVTFNSTEKNLSVVFADSSNNSTNLHYHLAHLTDNLPEWDLAGTVIGQGEIEMVQMEKKMIFNQLMKDLNSRRDPRNTPMAC
ncbi:anti-H(O) lectin 1-like [Eucalyptus grandis]|uniref:anti-H(O) lectin 1-like n=1 Tax=Eucalyptus grandis TaxID=71139 RepID=UPI00192E7CA9|nr:anti-H(O) lectin 1-like [Eucalyptus grandis]